MFRPRGSLGVDISVQIFLFCSSVARLIYGLASGDLKRYNTKPATVEKIDEHRAYKSCRF